eukprot:818093_1
MMCRRNIINRSPSMNRSKQTRNKPMRKSKQMRRRLDLSKYSDGSHDYLLKHVLMNDMCNRFNCSALTAQSLARVYHEEVSLFAHFTRDELLSIITQNHLFYGAKATIFAQIGTIRAFNIASAAAAVPHDEEEEEQEVDDPAMRTSCIDFVFNETRKMSIITVTYWWQ